MKYVFLIAISLVLVFFALQTSFKAISKKAPGFELTNIKGGIVELRKYEGKVVLLNYWATWCGPCVREIPDLNEIYKEFQLQGLEIIGISVDEQESTVKNFVKNTFIDYTVVMGNDTVIKNYGGLRGVPTTFVVDRQGHIRDEWIGVRNKNQMIAQIKALLAEK